jgi:hypothetical protein
MGTKRRFSNVTLHGVTKRMADVVGRRGCGKWKVRLLVLNYAVHVHSTHSNSLVSHGTLTTIPGTSFSGRIEPTVPHSYVSLPSSPNVGVADRPSFTPSVHPRAHSQAVQCPTTFETTRHPPRSEHRA